MKLNEKKREIVESLNDAFGAIVSRKQTLAFIKSRGGTIADVRFIFNTKSLRAGRGQYDLSSLLSNGVDNTVETETVENTGIESGSVVGTPTVAA